MPEEQVVVPKVFGWEHIVYLCIFVAVSAAGIVLFKLKAKDRAVGITIKAVGAALIALLVWNRISIAIFKGNNLLLLPDSLCGVTSLALGICALVCKRDALPFHCLCYIGFFGGAANVVYPYYVSQDPNFMLPATISGLLHHGISLDLTILMFLSGWFKPSLKKFAAFPIGMCMIMTYGIFLIDALGVASVGDGGFVTAMNIFSPLVPGTFFSWYIVFPLMGALIFGLLLLYEKVIKKRVNEKVQTPEP